MRNEDGHGDSHSRHNRSWSWAPVSTSCGHLFHKGCILEWFRCRRHYEGSSRLRGSCPTCRKPIAIYNLTRVYLTPSDPVTVPSPPPPSTATASPSETSQFSSIPSVATQHSDLRELYDHDNGVDPLLPESEQDDHSSNRDRLYSEFFNLSTGRRSRYDALRLRLRFSRSRRERESQISDDFSYMDIDCENRDCVDLRNAFYILTRECKSLQRRLNLEMDVSKMKSILVASQQRDINVLKLRKGLPERTIYVTLGFGLLLSIWLTVCVGLIFSIVTRLGGINDSDSSVEEL